MPVTTCFMETVQVQKIKKNQESSNSKRGARAPYLTMFPQISAPCFCIKLSQIPVSRHSMRKKNVGP